MSFKEEMDLVESRAAKVKLGHSLVDWSVIDNTTEMTAALVGSVAYWDSHEFKGMRDIEIELSIMNSVSQYEWHTARPYDKPMWEHWCALMRLLNPQKTDITPYLYNTAQAICILYGTGGKGLNLLGAQSVSKTGGVSRIIDSMMAMKAEKSMPFISCPTDKVSDTGAWGELKMISKQTNRNHPWLWPDFKAYGKHDRTIRYVDADKFGSAIARNMSDAGNYQGTKAHSDGDGFFIVYCDEINKAARSAYEEIQENITSNDQYLAINSWNWKTNEDLGAVISVPDIKRMGHDEHSKIHIDNDQVYDSVGETITLRFDGALSPNILCGKRITPYNLFRQDNWDYLVSVHGADSAVVKSQARAYPDVRLTENTILSKNIVHNSKWKDAYTIEKEICRVSFLDAAFKVGGDKPLYGWARVCEIAYMEQGNKRSMLAMVFEDYFRELKLVEDAFYNDYWFERLDLAGLPRDNVEYGQKVTSQDQLVIQCAEKNNELTIPHRNHGFDFSMDDELPTSYNKFMGFEAVSFNYKIEPEGIYIPHLKEESSDFCYNRADELAFQIAGTFHAGQIRGGHFIETAMEETCRTRYEERGKKRKTESKADFKANTKNGRGEKVREKQKSPDNRDVLFGIRDMARKRGGLVLAALVPDADHDEEDFDFTDYGDAGKPRRTRRL